MLKHSPPESVHALDLSKLAHPTINFFTLWFDNELAGFGALKRLNDKHGEIKSMRTAQAHLRKGVAQQLLTHLITFAKQRGLHTLSLETGTAQAFEPAHRLYQQFGFKDCLPFADYQEDPFSRFMSKKLV